MTRPVLVSKTDFLFLIPIALVGIQTTSDGKGKKCHKYCIGQQYICILKIHLTKSDRINYCTEHNKTVLHKHV